MNNVSAKPSYLERRLNLLTFSRRRRESSEEVRGPLGLNLLYSPSEPCIDFVFVCQPTFATSFNCADRCLNRFTVYVGDPTRHGVKRGIQHYFGQKNGCQRSQVSRTCASIVMVMTRTGEREPRALSTYTILAKHCLEISRTHPIYDRAWM